jgi:hypothetical protein
MATFELPLRGVKKIADFRQFNSQTRGERKLADAISGKMWGND